MEIKSNGWFNIALTILFDDLSDYRLIKADVFKVMMIMMGDDNYDDVFKMVIIMIILMMMVVIMKLL